jgi:hypothetical protein
MLCIPFMPNLNKVSAASLPGSASPLWAMGTTKTSTTLYWDTATDATSYVLKRDGTVIYTGSATQFTDTGLVENRTYTYSVSGKNSYGNGIEDIYKVTTLKTPTKGLTVTGTTNNSIKLRIDTSDYYNADELTLYQNGVQIYHSTNFPVVFDYTVNNLEPGLTYEFKIHGSDPTIYQLSFDYYVSGTTDNTQTAAEIQEYDEESTYFDRTNLSAVPVGTPVLNFDTVEEFEAAINQMEIDTLAEQQAQLNEPAIIDEGTVNQSGTITTFATTYNGVKSIKWIPTSWNPLRQTILPFWMYIDFSFTYTGSGTSKKFSTIKSVKSYSTGFPTSWHQTQSVTNLYDSDKGVSITVVGYHLLGVAIAGQTIGARFSDSFTKKYHW